MEEDSRPEGLRKPGERASLREARDWQGASKPRRRGCHMQRPGERAGRPSEAGAQQPSSFPDLAGWGGRSRGASKLKGVPSPKPILLRNPRPLPPSIGGLSGTSSDAQVSPCPALQAATCHVLHSRPPPGRWPGAATCHLGAAGQLSAAEREREQSVRTGAVGVHVGGESGAVPFSQLENLGAAKGEGNWSGSPLLRGRAIIQGPEAPSERQICTK